MEFSEVTNAEDARTAARKGIESIDAVRTGSPDGFLIILRRENKKTENRKTIETIVSV